MATAGFNVTDDIKSKADELADQFAKNGGGNKSDFFRALLETYQMQMAAGAMPGRSDEIAHVDELLGQFKTVYLASLTLAQNAADVARKEQAATIERNEKTISDLQEKSLKLKEAADAAHTERDAARTELKERTAELDSIKKELEATQAAAEETIEQTKRFNETLQAQMDEMRKKAEESATELEAAATLEAESEKLKDDLKAAIERAEKAEAEAAGLSKKLTEQAEKAKTDATELKGRYDEKFDNLREKLENEKQSAILDERRTGEAQLRAAVDAADEKHQERIDKMQAAIDKLTSQRDQWQEKFYALREKSDKKE